MAYEVRNRKLSLDTCLSSTHDSVEYGSSWSRGVETRLYSVSGGVVAVCLEGWASADMLAAFERGDEGEGWPDFFYTSRWVTRWAGSVTGGGVKALTGGKVTASDVEPYRVECPGNYTLGWVWSFVLDQVERHL